MVFALPTVHLHRARGFVDIESHANDLIIGLCPVLFPRLLLRNRYIHQIVAPCAFCGPLMGVRQVFETHELLPRRCGSSFFFHFDFPPATARIRLCFFTTEFFGGFREMLHFFYMYGVASVAL